MFSNNPLPEAVSSKFHLILFTQLCTSLRFLQGWVQLKVRSRQDQPWGGGCYELTETIFCIVNWYVFSRARDNTYDNQFS